ncbi:MAG: terminase large subunit [Desulfovibrio sp.]|nr:terminase large subunit [Desulfovibrio sp.]
MPKKTEILQLEPSLDTIPSRFMAPGSYYDKLAADIAVAFIEQLKHPGAEWYGEPFELMPWQETMIRNIFGIKRANGFRQIRTCYAEIPKKQGKSELAAAVALILTCIDREPRAEVYSCACDRGQASLVFDVACDMVDMNPDLRRYFKTVSSEKKLIYLPTNSFYRVLSAESYTKHGFNVHGLIFDELHALPDRRFYDVMTHGSGRARRQPLHFIITTAGSEKGTVCWEKHQHAVQILKGERTDHSFYPTIFAADESDDWTSEATWRKANPSIGVTCDIEDVRADFDLASTSAVEENIFKQLYLNLWVNNAVRWMPSAVWNKCAFHVDAKKLKGKKCYAGLDLSCTNDITAFVLVFPPDNPMDETDKYQILPFLWIAEEKFKDRVKKDNVPYQDWVDKGLLHVTPGNIIQYSFVEQRIKELSYDYEIREIAFDKWGAHMMMQRLKDAGMHVIEYPQSYEHMSPPTKELMRLACDERIAHGGHAALDWMMGNVYVQNDSVGNIKPTKKKSSEYIDGIIAMIMGLSRAILHHEPGGKLIIVDLDDDTMESYG